jgi:hypothetical protein
MKNIFETSIPYPSICHIVNGFGGFGLNMVNKHLLERAKRVDSNNDTLIHIFHILE